MLFNVNIVKSYKILMSSFMSMFLTQDLLRHFTPTPRKVSLASYGAPDWYTHHSKPPAVDESK